MSVNLNDSPAKGGSLGMRRFLAASTALLLMALGSQAVLAQYQPTGTLAVSQVTPTAGGPVTISGSGFAPLSPVQITIESSPVLLSTITADSTGAFATQVTIPASFAGAHTIFAIGTDSTGSVRVLAAPVSVVGVGPPGEIPSTDAAPNRSDPFVFALAGAGIVLMTGILLLVTRRRRPLG
ncbi:MAG: hypothetical protein ACXWH0_14880 [Acidimicrobiia bacterium]